MHLNARTIKMQELGLADNTIVNAGVEDPNAQCISWVPGDGYKYNVIFNILPKSINYLIGGSEHHILVSYHDGLQIKTWNLIDGATHTMYYIAERFGLDANNDRTKYLTALLNMTIGNFSYGYEIYENLKGTK